MKNKCWKIETVVIKLDTMRPLLEDFEYAEMPSADTEKEG
jgi:hypothetical protein